jgi:hypothetical protein
LTVNTYSPSDIDLLIGGYKVTGWKSINIKKDAASYIFIRGIRGKNTRVRNYNKSALIEIVLAQTSATNDIFSEVHRKDIVDNDYDELNTADCARLEISLKDRSGTSVFQSEDAYIVSYPDVTFSDNFEDRSWKIQCLTTNVFTVGGNLRPATGLIDSIFNAFI